MAAPDRHRQHERPDSGSARHIERYGYIVKLAYEMAAIFADMLEPKKPILSGNGLSMFDFEPGAKFSIESDNLAPGRPPLKCARAF
jgi:hypothetical protein